MSKAKPFQNEYRLTTCEESSQTALHSGKMPTCWMTFSPISQVHNDELLSHCSSISLEFDLENRDRINALLKRKSVTISIAIT